jgi:hypothetical protein
MYIEYVFAIWHLVSTFLELFHEIIFLRSFSLNPEPTWDSSNVNDHKLFACSCCKELYLYCTCVVSLRSFYICTLSFTEIKKSWKQMVECITNGCLVSLSMANAVVEVCECTMHSGDGATCPWYDEKKILHHHIVLGSQPQADNLLHNMPTPFGTIEDFFCGL